MKKSFFQDHRHPWVKATEFRDLRASELLSSAIEARQQMQPQKKSAWVFDLDSTLFCLGPRIKHIYFEFLRDHPQPKEHWQRALPLLNPATQRYNIRETFEMIFEPWNREQAHIWALELWFEFERFWTERFFSNRHLHHDDPYPGAVDYVKRVLEAGFEVVYLTGRDRPRTGHGTMMALKNAGFPIGENTALLMKPQQSMGDVEYKERAARELRSKFDVSVLIDNEPENLVMFAHEFEHAMIVFYHTIMSERVPERDFRNALRGREALRLEDYLA
jgi:hypothetical protein